MCYWAPLAPFPSMQEGELFHSCLCLLFFLLGASPWIKKQHQPLPLAPFPPPTVCAVSAARSRSSKPCLQGWAVKSPRRWEEAQGHFQKDAEPSPSPTLHLMHTPLGSAHCHVLTYPQPPQLLLRLCALFPGTQKLLDPHPDP